MLFKSLDPALAHVSHGRNPPQAQLTNLQARDFMHCLEGTGFLTTYGFFVFYLSAGPTDAQVAEQQRLAAESAGAQQRSRIIARLTSNHGESICLQHKTSLLELSATNTGVLELSATNTDVVHFKSLDLATAHISRNGLDSPQDQLTNKQAYTFMDCLERTGNMSAYGFFVFYSNDGPTDAQVAEQQRLAESAVAQQRSRITTRLTSNPAERICLQPKTSALELSATSADVVHFDSLDLAMEHISRNGLDSPQAELSYMQAYNFMHCLERTGNMSTYGFYVFYSSDGPHAKARMAQAVRLGIVPPVDVPYENKINSMIDNLVSGWQQEIIALQAERETLTPSDAQMLAIIALEISNLEGEIAKFAEANI